MKTRNSPKSFQYAGWLLKKRKRSRFWFFYQRHSKQSALLTGSFILPFFLIFLALLSFTSITQAQVTITYNYDETTSTHGKGRLTSMTDTSGSSKFYYDNMGRIRRTDKVVDGTMYTLQAGYDLLGRTDSITYPDSSVVNYAYNGPLLDRVYEGSTNYAQYGGYNALGQPGTVTHGNGVVTTSTYSNSANGTCPKQNFRPCTIAIGNFQTLTYDYDNGQLGVGNITSITNTANGNQTFAYDDLDRLTSTTGPYGTGGATATLSYAYDQIGNMTSNSKLGTYTYPASGAASVRPHAVSTAGPNSYGYDANGNMISGAGRTINYNAENRPTSITNANGTTTFVHDGSGGRVKKIIAAGTTIYIGKLYECTNGSCSKYIFAGSERIALKPVGGTAVYYYHSDHQDSSSVVTNQSGAKVQDLAYFPYGETRLNSGTVDVHHKYTSQELDDSTGLYFYNARYYDPILGRFIQADTIVPDSADPQAFNRYSYVRNNPLKYTDPTGHGWKKFRKKLKKAVKKAVKHAGWVAAPVAMANYKAFHKLPEKYQVVAIQAGSIAGSVACPACAPAIAAGAAMAMADISGGSTRDMLKAGAIGGAVGALSAGVGSSVSTFAGPGLAGAMAGGAASGFVGGAGTTLAAGGNLRQALRAGLQGGAVGAGTAAVMYNATQAVQSMRSQGEGSIATPAVDGNTRAQFPLPGPGERSWCGGVGCDLYDVGIAPPPGGDSRGSTITVFNSTSNSVKVDVGAVFAQPSGGFSATPAPLGSLTISGNTIGGIPVDAAGSSTPRYFQVDVCCPSAEFHLNDIRQNPQ